MLAVALHTDKEPAGVLLPEMVEPCATTRLPMKPKLPVMTCSASMFIAQLATRSPRKCRYWPMSLKLFSIRKDFLVVPVRAVLTASVLCYLGAVAWLYERPRLGILSLVLVAALDLIACWLNQPQTSNPTRLGEVLHALDPVTGGLLLGATMAAM